MWIRLLACPREMCSQLQNIWVSACGISDEKPPFTDWKVMEGDHVPSLSCLSSSAMVGSMSSQPSGAFFRLPTLPIVLE